MKDGKTLEQDHLSYIQRRKMCRCRAIKNANLVMEIGSKVLLCCFVSVDKKKNKFWVNTNFDRPAKYSRTQKLARLLKTLHLLFWKTAAKTKIRITVMP